MCAHFLILYGDQVNALKVNNNTCLKMIETFGEE